MQPHLELSGGLTATCCNALQYLEGAAYIAIVLAVFGVPQLLTYYLDRRDRRRDRREDRAEAERARQGDRAEAERARQEERAEAERMRREERAEAERRHLETMAVLTGTIAALTAILERNGHTPADQSTAIEQLERRIAELEAEIALLRNGDHGGYPHGSTSE